MEDEEKMAALGSGPVGRWGRAGGLLGTVRAEKSTEDHGLWSHGQSWERREGGIVSTKELGDDQRMSDCET